MIKRQNSNLKKYDSDKYSAQAKYDTQGNLEQAGQSDNSGTEDADWGEGVGMFHKITDNDGNILWEGISEDAYNKMSAKEQKEVTGIVKSKKKFLVMGQMMCH